MELKINVVDAFTDKAFKGNAAAVIIVEDWLNDALMQAIALENNLSETAFVKLVATNSYEIRWFSPITEIDFCGHATLAASFVIFKLHQDVKKINFYAKAVGNLSVTEQSNGYIEMIFPNKMPEIVDDIPAALINGLSIKPQEVLLNDQAYFAVYQDESAVRSVQQNIEWIKQLAPFDVVVTAQSTEYDFVSRYFWPANGGQEDPVTGSIHSGLAPFWAIKLNKLDLVAFQASARGGKLLCCVKGDKVHISGKAVKYLEGIITV